MIDNLEDFVAVIIKIKKKAEASLPVLQHQIDEIIQQREQNPHKIEQILDILLDYGQIGVGKKEFKRLNKYYTSFNIKNAQFYKQSYTEIATEK